MELYDGQAFAWIVIGKHCGDIDGYDDEFSVGYNGSNPAPLETRDIPAEGDTIVLDGNRHRNEHGEYDKTDRQNVIILETTGEYAPRIACYANITEYKHTFTKSVNGSDKRYLCRYLKPLQMEARKSTLHALSGFRKMAVLSISSIIEAIG